MAGIGASAQARSGLRSGRPPAAPAECRSSLFGRTDLNQRSRGSLRFPLRNSVQRTAEAPRTFGARDSKFCFAKFGAGSGNRTRVASLGSWSTTTVLYPRRPTTWLGPPSAARNARGSDIDFQNFAIAFPKTAAISTNKCSRLDSQVVGLHRKGKRGSPFLSSPR